MLHVCLGARERPDAKFHSGIRVKLRGMLGFGVLSYISSSLAPLYLVPACMRALLYCSRLIVTVVVLLFFQVVLSQLVYSYSKYWYKLSIIRIASSVNCVKHCCLLTLSINVCFNSPGELCH